jgi:uncharacterized protein (DUF2147 family)
MEILITKELITQRFNELNKKFFNSELVLNFDIKIIKSKKKGGCVVHNAKQSKVISFNISNFYKRDSHQLNELIVHEMIHVAQVQKRLNMDFGGHGTSFKRYVNDIKKIDSSFNITITENSMEFEASDKNNLQAKGSILAVVCKDYIFVGSESHYDSYKIATIKRGLQSIPYFNDNDINNTKILIIDKKENKRYSVRRSRLILEKHSNCNLVSKINNTGITFKEILK